MIRVAVSGALGRMGRLACETIRNSPDVQFAGGLARSSLPNELIFDDPAQLFEETKPDVLIDFTVRPATQQIVKAAVERGIHPVVGSSEWNETERAELRELCETHGVGALLVPNFAMGAVLMMRFAQEAARFFPTVEIVELHREEKRDKPSGTALATAERIRAHGGPREVPVHSVRLRGLLAHQEVLFGNTGELLTIRHDSFSRESFAQGMLFAIRHVRDLRGLHVGLDSVMPGHAEPVDFGHAEPVDPGHAEPVEARPSAVEAPRFARGPSIPQDDQTIPQDDRTIRQDDRTGGKP